VPSSPSPSRGRLGWGWDYCKGEQSISLVIKITKLVIASEVTLALISLASILTPDPSPNVERGASSSFLPRGEGIGMRAGVLGGSNVGFRSIVCLG
jgi:hypothetical protein